MKQKRKRIKNPIYSSNTSCPGTGNLPLQWKNGRLIEAFNAHTVTEYDYLFGYVPHQENMDELIKDYQGK